MRDSLSTPTPRVLRAEDSFVITATSKSGACHDVGGVIGIVTSHTYSRWVVDRREGRKPKPVRRPKIARNLCELVKRLAKENADWGYRRIIGELRMLRLRIGRSSVRRILKDAGMTPSPYCRGRAKESVWRKFIRLHLNTLVACDFFAKSVITPLGPRLAFCLAFIHVGTRKVFLTPSTCQRPLRKPLRAVTGQSSECRYHLCDAFRPNVHLRLHHDAVLPRGLHGGA